MRIIAGLFRGREILPPLGNLTRPITDRAKQSLFDILSPSLPDAVVYDLFAGTGSLGLECLSRGSQSALFFESDPSAGDRLQQNIRALKLGGHTRVIRKDLFRWFDDESEPAQRADLLFLDPPYRFLTDRPRELQSLAAELARRHLVATATVVFRHDVQDQLDLPGLRAFDVRDYGQMRIELLHLCT